jgi:ribosome-associated heat shock protein Hsp15
MASKLRLDHYLFRARLFKSRSQATSACKEGRVLVNGEEAKPSSDVSAGDLLKIREKGLYRHIRILELPGKNMPKAEAKETWSDETPEEVRRQKEMVQAAQRVRGPFRDQGAKPSKKERRELEKLRGFKRR